MKEIYSCTDEHGALVILEFQNTRVLTFDSVYEQSRVCLGHPTRLDHEYAQAMLLPLLQDEPQHITLLGLGAGSLANCLFHLLPESRLVAVELRQIVIDAAYEYFALPVDERLRVLHMDAKLYMANASAESTDFILSDLYSAYSVSPVQVQREFYQQCHNMLTEHGWLALNYHGLSSVQWEYLRDYFPSIYLLSVTSGNWVILACKSPNDLLEQPLSALHRLPMQLILKLRMHRRAVIPIDKHIPKPLKENG